MEQRIKMTNTLHSPDAISMVPGTTQLWYRWTMDQQKYGPDEQWIKKSMDQRKYGPDGQWIDGTMDNMAATLHR